MGHKMKNKDLLFMANKEKEMIDPSPWDKITRSIKLIDLREINFYNSILYTLHPEWKGLPIEEVRSLTIEAGYTIMDGFGPLNELKDSQMMLKGTVIASYKARLEGKEIKEEKSYIGG